ncbi:MAG: MotA/TolQ/ExbB proton channel family protein [Verrucomicrobiota bacterium]|nr:MotA/TolQ/ExbB proton channel family protein [Verrucomicrobiota bacterium]
MTPYFFASGGVIYAFENSNFAGKFILLLLGIGSILSWSVIITKMWSVHKARKQADDFLKKFRADRKPLKLFMERVSYDANPMFEIYVAGCRELSYHMLGSENYDETYRARLQRAERISLSEMTSIRVAMEKAVGEQGLKLESQMILLSTTVSGSPFLGLLGTVWGVMDTFSDIAKAGSASLLAMAPGVSGALITTVTSLAVAIPAMFGYNYLITSIRSLTIEMDNFAAELAASMEREYVDHNKLVS